MKRIVYMIWFLIKRPYVSMSSKLDKLGKPKLLLDFWIILSLVAIFRNTFVNLWNLVAFEFDYISYSIIFLTVCVYIWKYTAKSNGELWLKEYKDYNARKILKQGIKKESEVVELPK